MTVSRSGVLYRFGIFEADSATGELRRKGARIRLPSQPFQILLLLLARPGELVTREEICRELWPEGTFVDYDHGLNSAVNRLREALGDKAGSARFVETLARRGYRFTAPVDRVEPGLPVPVAADNPSIDFSASAGSPGASEPESIANAEVGTLLDRVLASPQDLPRVSQPVVRVLFALLQCMYIGFYIGSLANLPEIDELLSVLTAGDAIYRIILFSAIILIPVRTFLLFAVAFRAPRLQGQFLMLWPFLFIADLVWSLSPFLLLHHISFGLALACVPFLVYSPLAQRALMLMAHASGTSEPPAVRQNH